MLGAVTNPGPPRRRAAAAVNSPVALARRIVKAFNSGTMTQAQKEEVLAVLADLRRTSADRTR